MTRSTVLDFEQIFNDYMAGNQKTWAHDRTQSLGGSEAFKCLRQSWFSKRGAEFGFAKDADHVQGWGATERGNIIENNYVVPALTSSLPRGVALLFAGDDQETLHEGRNSATPDGLIIGLARDALTKYGVADIGSDCVVMEIKSIDPRVSLREEKAIHHGQAQVQMGLIRDTTKWKPNYAIIIYIDASFLDNISVFVVPYEQSKWDIAKDRAATIWEIDTPTAITPEGRITGDCALCAFQSACAGVQRGSLPEERKKYEYSVEAAEEMAALVETYLDAKDAAKEAEADFERAKIAVQQHLRENDARRMQDPTNPKKPSWKASTTWVKGANRLQQTALVEHLREEHPEIDLDPFYAQGEGYEKLTITISA